jgi:hypothetical protein
MKCMYIYIYIQVIDQNAFKYEIAKAACMHWYVVFTGPRLHVAYTSCTVSHASCLQTNRQVTATIEDDDTGVMHKSQNMCFVYMYKYD